MRLTMGCVALLSALSGASAGERLYDVKLEQATKDVVARKIGSLRTGFNFRHSVAMDGAASAPADAKPWSVVTSTPTASTTVGSIQTYAGGASATASPRRAGQKVPRVLKF